MLPGGSHAWPLVHLCWSQVEPLFEAQQSSVARQVSSWTRHPSAGWQTVVPVPRFAQVLVQQSLPVTHGFPAPVQLPEPPLPPGRSQVPTPPPSACDLKHSSEQHCELSVQMS
jgi:hypothetical protein